MRCKRIWAGRKWNFLFSGFLFMGVGYASAQDLNLFFSSSVLDETTDDYGNVYQTSPKDAVVPLPADYGVAVQPVLKGFLVDSGAIYETKTDGGNSYTTVAADSALSAAEVFNTAAVTTDNLWQKRTGGLPNLSVLETRAPAGTEDAPTLKTTVTMALGGTYEVFLLFGDIGTIGTDDEQDSTPIQAAMEGQELKTFLQADGNLVGDYGFNVLEVSLGSITVTDGGSFSVLVDDVVGTGARTAYQGLRITQEGPTLPPDPPTYDFNLDDKWTVYGITGRTILISYGPGSGENAPALTTEITLAFPGTYEVIFNFLDSNNNPDQGAINAKLNDGVEETYGAAIATRAPGGTSPAYPWIHGTNIEGDNMFWYSAVLGQVTGQAGDTIRIHVDDVQDWSGLEYMTSAYEGVTLRVIEGGPVLQEIQVSPVFRYNWGTDDNGNRYNTVAADSSLTLEQSITDTRSNSDSLWAFRPLGIYGGVLESFSGEGTEDSPQLKTTVEVAKGGAYDVFLLYGDVGAIGTDDAASPNAVIAGFEGEEMKTFFQGDGTFIGLWGFNILETKLGQKTVADGGQINVLIDDIPAQPTEITADGDVRSVYAGLRIAPAETFVNEWTLY